jgi:mono/diheme cytochrome c family protein
MRNRFLIFLSTLTAGIVLAGCGSFSLAADVTPPPGAPQVQQPVSVQPQTSTQAAATVTFPLLPPDPQQGQAIYAQKCLPCHGKEGNGDGPQAGGLPVTPAAIGSPDLARAARPVDWFAMVSQGKIDRYMPGFQGSLNERQIWNVLAYVDTLSSSKDQLDLGKKIYVGQCAACHGETGKGDGPDAAGKNVPDWSQQERLSKLSAQEMETVVAKGSKSMSAFADLSQDERWAVVAYVRSLTFQAPGEAAAITPQADATPQTEKTAQAQALTGTPGVQTTAAANVVIRGKISDAKGQPYQSALKVTLLTFQGMTQVADTSTTSRIDGTYEFTDVKTSADLAYIVTVEAHQYTFNSDILQAKDITGKAAELPVTIYETSTDASALSADRMHVFFDFSKPGVAQVVELFIVSNPSDKLIVPAAADKPVLSFALPQNATNVQFQNGAIGDRFMQTAQGFGDLSPVQPGAGQHQVLFSYELPYDRKLDLSIPLTLNVGAAMVMVPAGGPNLSSDQLQSSGTRDAQGVTFQLYSGENMNSGSTLKLSLSGKIQNNVQSSVDLTELSIGLGALVLVLAGAGLWIFNQRRKETRVAVEILPDPDSEEALLDAILTLEDAFQAGELSEEAFTLRRAELKERLLRMHDRTER